MNRIPLLALVLLAGLSLAAAAQDSLLFANSATGGGQSLTNFSAIQTFTMPQDGELSRVRVRIFGGAGATLSYELCTTTPSASEPAGAPVLGAPLYSGSTVLPPGSGYRWVDLDVSPSGHAALAGDFLAISILPLASTFVATANSDPYPGGGLWIDAGATPSYLSGADMTFEAFVRGVAVTETQPYFEDFEDGAKGWIVTNGVWELGSPSDNYVTSAFSGTNCWATDLDDDYPSNAISAVSSGEFDCSSLSDDPVLSARITYDTFVWDDGMRIEFDLGDGSGWRTLGDASFYDSADNHAIGGGLSGIFWAGASPWREVRRVIPGAAGATGVRVRFLFGSDSAYDAFGAAVDDVRLEVPHIVVTASSPHFDDFEAWSGGWGAHRVDYSPNFATGPVWEWGAPATPVLGGALSGSRCWATELDGLYPIAATAYLTSPACDFSALTEDPVLELSLRHDFSQATGRDGARVEMDLGDGNGFQILGSTADWYDATLSSNKAPGGPGWAGTSAGWRVLRHELTGTAGLVGVRLRIVMSSNIGAIAEGALVDDVHIFVPAFKGTETLLADDIRLQVYVDGVRRVGAGGVCSVQPGDSWELYSVSPEGDLVGGEFLLVGEVFPTGGGYANVLPDIWISLGSGSVLLLGGPQPPFNGPMTMAPGGVSFVSTYFGGMGGVSCRVQTLVATQAAVNGIYAGSDALELQFN